VGEWAEDLRVAPNTIRTWTRKHGLVRASDVGVLLIRPSDLVAFFNRMPGLVSVRRARAAYEAGPGFTAPAASTGSTVEQPVEPASRDEVRTLRARVATLDQRLDEALAETSRLRAERDYWQARARAHRRSLRDQLDLEDQEDEAAR
jgi:hypothetical protein